MDYLIRRARAEDAALLGGLEQAAARRFAEVGLARIAGGRPTAAEEYLEGIAAGLIWVAARGDGTLAGLAIAGWRDGQGYLAELSVHPGDAGRRLGARLIGEVEAWALREGFTRLSLTTFRDVPWNRPYYERLGFRVLAEEEIGPELGEVRRNERTRGLDDLSPRVAMMKVIREEPV